MLTTLLPPTVGRGDRRRLRHPHATRPACVAASATSGRATSGGHTQRVRDELHAQGAFYGMGRRETRARAAELIESLELDQVANRAVQSLSGGQKRRLDIALGLIHRPELLFLDEPSTGLDPHSRANLWEHIVDLRRATGTTIFLTTHYLDEADQLAERVMVMDHGAVIADDTARALKESLAGDRVTLVVRRRRRMPRPRRRASAAWSTGPMPVVTITAPGGDRALPRWIRALGDAGLDVVAATHRQPTLDDVFLALTGRSLREDGRATPTRTVRRRRLADRPARRSA